MDFEKLIYLAIAMGGVVVPIIIYNAKTRQNRESAIETSLKMSINGFENTNKEYQTKFETNFEKFINKIDEKFEKIDGKFGRITSNHEQRLNGHDAEINSIKIHHNFNHPNDQINRNV